MEDKPKQFTTLGDVLYGRRKRLVSEHQWVALVRAVAAGDQLALHALYERAHRLVFTLGMRITASRESAEELTLEVFLDVWRRAAAYDPAGGTVLAWIMNQARSRALARKRVQSHKVVQSAVQSRSLQLALTALTPGERQALEAAFYGDLTYADVAARLNQPVATVKTRIRSGLHNLRHALSAQEP